MTDDSAIDEYIKAYKGHEKAIDELATTLARIQMKGCGFKPGVRDVDFKRIECENDENLSAVFNMQPTYLKASSIQRKILRSDGGKIKIIVRKRFNILR